MAPERQLLFCVPADDLMTDQYSNSPFMSDHSSDVPSPIDLRTMHDAIDWEASAMEKRPWRLDFFKRITTEISQTFPQEGCVLELGSGPGFLAQHILSHISLARYVLLDFSPSMHILAAKRLGTLSQHAEFVERDFKNENWTKELGRFDCIVTNQAIHELRHKRYASTLHAQARQLLANGGIYLVCDHFVGDGGMKNNQLFMTLEEQSDALFAAGFENVEVLLMQGGLVLHRATK